MKTLSPEKMKGKLLFILLFSCIIGPVSAGLPKPQELLQEYLRIDTTNPPGNEMKSALFLEKIFKRHDIPVQVFDLGEGRANLMATLQGDGSLPPLILLHHMDVVPADKNFWKHDPFSGVIDNGEIYGRGSVDIKGKGIVDLMVMLKLKEEGIKLKRDIIYLAVADEENNSLGSKTIIKEKGELLKKAQFLIDEGATAKLGRYYVSLGEKSPLWLTLTFRGKTGHASIPHGDNPVEKAIEAGKKLISFAARMPLKVVPGTEKYLELNVKKDYLTFPGHKGNFKNSLRSQTFLKALALDPELNALMRNTVTITGLVGSDKVNTIPNQAKIRIDCRLLPGTSKDQFLDRIRKVVGKEVDIKIDEYYPAYFTSAKSSFLTALKKVVGEDKVVSTLLTSSTDSSLFRALGIEVFGFETYPLTQELISTAHGNDERLPVKSLEQGIDTLQRLVIELNR